MIDDADRGIGFLLTESARMYRKLLDRRLQPLGLSRAQWSVLAVLAHHDGPTQSQLAEMLEIEKTTTGRLIDQVQKSGWIERRPVPGDRRQWGVYLTEQALPLIAEVERIVMSTRVDVLDGLSTPERQALPHSLLAIKASLSRALSVDQSGLAHDKADD